MDEAPAGDRQPGKADGDAVLGHLAIRGDVAQRDLVPERYGLADIDAESLAGRQARADGRPRLCVAHGHRDVVAVVMSQEGDAVHGWRRRGVRHVTSVVRPLLYAAVTVGASAPACQPMRLQPAISHARADSPERG